MTLIKMKILSFIETYCIDLKKKNHNSVFSEKFLFLV